MFSSRRVRAGALALLFCSLPAIAHAETLREALTSAYVNNPSILSALLEVKATAENIAVAKSALLPQISAGVSGTQTYSFGSGTSGDPTLSANIGLSQNLFDGTSSARVDAARAGTDASRYSLAMAEQSVFMSVVQAYWGVIRDSQLVQLRKDNVAFYRAQVQSSKDRLDIGEGTKIDVSQAEARLAQGESSYQTALADLETSRASYERYVGHKPGNLSATYKLGTLLPTSLEAAINEAVSSHPGVLAARAGIRAAQAGMDEADGAFGPSLSFSGRLSGSVSPQNPEPNPTASATFNLSIPIYSGGRLGAVYRQANINQIKSEVDALATRDQIKESVISAWSSLQSANASITSANTAITSGELALEGVVQSRDVGQSTTLDVLDAQSDLTSIREGLIQATAARAIASFALVAATGHLTAADLSLDVQVKDGSDYIAKVEDVWAELRSLE